MQNRYCASRATFSAAHLRFQALLLCSSCLVGLVAVSPASAQSAPVCQSNPGGQTSTVPASFELQAGYIYPNMPAFYAICEAQRNGPGPDVNVTNAEPNQPVQLLSYGYDRPAAVGATSRGNSTAGTGAGGNVTVTNKGEVDANFTALAGISEGFGGSAGGSVIGTNSGTINVLPLEGSSFAGNPASLAVLQSAQGDGLYLASIGGIGTTGVSNTGGHYVVGGSGGSGGIAGSVRGINSATRLSANGDYTASGVPISSIHIETDMGDGISAMSVGGGGGDGGSASANDFYSAVAIGGSGGTGGHGGVVTVENGGNIDVQGWNSIGIKSMSIGGGGGQGGGAGASSAAFAGIGGSFAMATGGSGGAAGDGGAVSVQQLATGSIQTGAKGDASANLDAGDPVWGDFSTAILAQSVGGGGGTSGSSFVTGSTNISLGTSGGDGNDGGTITINNVTTNTSGGAAVGILAQSIGGGGGHVGNGSLNQPIKTLVSDVNDVLRTSLNFMPNGSAGNGGAVNVGCGQSVVANCSINVTTTGATGIGILAQSIGGGGGTAQASLVNLDSFAISLGIQPEGSGASGLVSVRDDPSRGRINVVTRGDGAIGIVAQSIDSGGGALLFDASTTGSFTYNGGSGSAGSNGGTLVDLFGQVTTTGNNASGIFIQSQSNVHTLFDTSGHKVYGGLAASTGKNVAILESGSKVTTQGTGSHGLEILTHSLAAAQAPSMVNGYAPTGVNGSTVNTNPVRAQTINIQGSINVSGGQSWGVFAQNQLTQNDITVGNILTSPSNFTTHAVVGPNASITSAGTAFGGMNIIDAGNAQVDVFGSISAPPTPASDFFPSAIRLEASNVNLYTDKLSNVIGNIDVNITDPSGSANINLFGNVTGNLNVKANGARVDILQSNGPASNLVNGNPYYAGSINGYDTPNPYRNFSPRVNGRAIQIDSVNATINVSNVIGVIKGADIGPNPYAAASLISNGSITGTIDGAFKLKPTAGENGSITLIVDGSGGPSDYINIAGVDLSTSVLGATALLSALPTPNFKPFDIIRVKSINVADRAAIRWEFPRNANTGSLTWNFIQTPSPAVVDDAEMVITLTGFSVDFTRMTDGNNNTVKFAHLANKQVAAIANGSITLNPNDPNDVGLSYWLLSALHERDADDLASDLSVFDTTYQSSHTESATNASTNAANTMQSCGGEVSASVNPVSQGECHWGRVTFANGRRDDGRHRDSTTEFALGHQFELSKRYFLGLGAFYNTNRFTGPSSCSEGERLGVGAVAKFTDDKSFASVTALASYGWGNMRRKVSVTSANLAPMEARADQDTFVFLTRVRAGHRFDLGVLDIIPSIDLDVPIVHDFGYTETGAGRFNMKVLPNTNLLVELHPSVQFGKYFKVGGAGVRVFGELGQRQALNEHRSSISLANGFDNASSTDITFTRDQKQWTYGLGLIVDHSDRIETRVTYELDQGNQDRNERFSLKAAFKF